MKRLGGLQSRAGWWAGLLAAAGAIVTAGPVKADACSECGPPSLSQLQQQPGFTLETRDFGIISMRDHYETDGGECRLTIDGQPKVSKRSEWIAASMFGEAMNCPEGKMVSHIRLALQHSEHYDWHLDSSIGAELDVPLLAKLKEGLGGGAGGGGANGVVAEIDQVVDPAYCHRLRWCAYFLVGDFGATAPWSLERRFAWWTKNGTTGGAVHASGQMWVRCDGGSASMSHWVPISSHVALYDRSCGGCPRTASRWLGWFPPLPGALEGLDPLKDEVDNDDPVLVDPDSPPLPPAPPAPPKPPLGPDGKEPVDPNAPPVPPAPAAPPAPVPPPPQPPAPPIGPMPMDPADNSTLSAAPVEAAELHARISAPLSRVPCA